jgi:transposase-like protein
MKKAPRSLQEAIVYFDDYDNCKDFLITMRWPDGNVKCPQCGSEKISYLEKARLWKCYEKHERPKFSIKTGSIMEDSPIALDKWLTAMWLIVNCKNGISSCEIARDLKITQKSAWFLDHRIRAALHSGSFEKLSGEVEVDETYIGGKARNMHRDRRAKVLGQHSGPFGKLVVQGLLERHGGRVHARVVGQGKHKPLLDGIVENVETGSTVYTDETPAYDHLGIQDYAHKVIKHAEKYVDGQVHTNTIENFWSCLKRGLNGTYVSVEPFHLFRYLDEQMFRFNNRKGMDDYDRFELAASKIFGKRLTWEHLTGKKQDPQTNLN